LPATIGVRHSTSYPTAPHFRPDVSAETYAAWLSELRPDTTLSLYLHVPFCAELFLYCGCNTIVARSYTTVASYVDPLEQEIEHVAQHDLRLRRQRADRIILLRGAAHLSRAWLVTSRRGSACRMPWCSGGMATTQWASFTAGFLAIMYYFIPKRA
jgi:hypothetical protein